MARRAVPLAREAKRSPGARPRGEAAAAPMRPTRRGRETPPAAGPAPDFAADPAPASSPAVLEKLPLLPDRPGCYIYRDAAGTVLYVGKALSLRSRVRSYFHAGRGLEGKTLALVALIADVEWIVTDSEAEALILENDLIKRHRPKYNIRLRDDKQYPYLRCDVSAPWPRLEIVRRPAADGARYFGPFPHSQAVWQTMQILRRVFPYRSCSDRRLRQPHACLYHHIHRCLAPCIAAVEAAEYRQMVGELVQFLEGRGEAVLTRLQERMLGAAEDMRFEEAADFRDRIAALRSVLERQGIQLAAGEERDVLAVAAGTGGEAAVQAFFFRDGRMAGRDGFVLTGAEGRAPGEILQAFVEQFYGGGAAIPAEVLVSCRLPDQEGTQAWLRSRRGRAVRVVAPTRGPRRKLVELVTRNADEFLAADQWRREKSREALSAALEDLARALRLPSPPRRIECYDNSNLQGTSPVSAMVVFEDGAPKKADYRKFRVRTVVGADDFATMREILGRRFARLQPPEGAAPPGMDAPAPAGAPGPGGFAARPDLVIIDGGRGQLSAALAVMRAAGAGDVPTFGLAKENEWLYREGSPEPIVLPRTSPALRLLQRLRDEAHRFGLGYHRQLRGKASVASRLEEAPGIGPKRRKALLQAFGSLAAIREAGVDAVAAVRGMTRPAAEELLAYLNSGE